MTLSFAVLLQVAAMGPEPDVMEAVPATTVLCDMTSESGERFRLVTLFPRIPDAGKDRGVPSVKIDADAIPGLSGEAIVSAKSSTSFFRDYTFLRSAKEGIFSGRFNLRYTGNGVAWLTKSDPALDKNVFRYLAVGFCRSNFAGKPL